jgi:hypothetical protein
MPNRTIPDSRSKGQAQSVAKKLHLGENHPAQLYSRFVQTMETALEKVDPKSSVLSAAQGFYNERKFEFAALFDQWAVRRIVRLMQKRRAPDERQAAFPGFDLLPASIVGKQKKRMPLLKATYADLRQYRWSLTARARQNPKVRQVEKLMALLEEKPRGTRVQDLG